MNQASYSSIAAPRVRTTARRSSRTLARPEGYTPEQVFVGAAVIGILTVSLFSLVLWRELTGDCWEKHSSNRACATSSADAGDASWSPSGMGSLSKSQLLQ